MLVAVATVALAAFAAVAPRVPAATGTCRCMPSQSCWPPSSEWSALNASVGGRLQKSVDELHRCLQPGAVRSEACWGQLNRTDDEFWIADQPNGYQVGIQDALNWPRSWAI
jgi:hypothetical protein